MFVFPLLPPMGPLTEMGMKALGIFLGLLWAWTFVDFVWPSLLGMVAVGLSGFMTIDQAFTAGFGNTTTIMIAIVFILAGFLTTTGITKTIAYWFVSRKVCIGKPYMFLFLLMTAMYIVGGCAGTVATFVVGWAIIYEIAAITGYKRRDPFIAVLLVGTVFSALLGSTVWTFRPFAVMALNTSKKILGLDCSFIGWFIPSFCASYAALVLYVLAIKFIFRPDVSKLEGEDDIFAGFRSQIQVTGEQKLGAAVVIAVILLASIPSFLPAGNPVKAFLAQFSIGPIIAMILAAVYVIKKADGSHIFDYPGIIGSGVDWKTIVMLASSFPVAAMIQSPDSGVSKLINDFLQSLLGGYSPFVISCIFVLFTILMTQVAHNLIMMIVLAPILCNLSATMGFDPMPALMMLAFAANSGFATPGASIMGAMIFSNREWISVGQAFKYTWLAVGVIAITMCLLGVPIASAMHVGIPVAQ